MTLLGVTLLAAITAHVDAVYFTATADQKLAVRVLLTGTPEGVAVHREGEATRVSIMGAGLGGPFAGGRHFSWTSSDGTVAPGRIAGTSTTLDRLEIDATSSDVGLVFRVPSDVAIDVRREERGLLLVFHKGPEPLVEDRRRAKSETPPARAAPTAPAEEPPAAPASTPEPPAAKAAPAAPSQAPGPPASDTATLAKRLFPAGSSEGQAATSSVAALYPQLFPSGAPVTHEAEPAPTEAPGTGADEGVVLGPFRVRAAVDARYVDADTFVESTAQPTRDKYLEVQPRVLAAAPVGMGALRLEYSPVFRALATYDQVNTNSHLVGAGLELPLGPNVMLRGQDRFQSGLLDTRVVDPGGEYFYGLGHFNRNDVDAGASVAVGPRLSVELRGALGHVHFTEPSSFFDYDTRTASAGLGFDLTSRLRATAAYVYDSVPRPDERPEAEAVAHSGQLTLNGDILPRLSGELAVGYRSEDAPNAGPGGTHYSGLALHAALVRELGSESSFSLLATRSTPVSAFEENAFYVSTGIQGVLSLPLPLRVEARGAIGYQWNDYRTVASEIGEPREDHILGWYAGLRRPIGHGLALGAAYRSEHRRSNIDTYDTNADGFYFTLEWDFLGAPPR